LSSPIKILIVDDHPVVREALACRVAKNPEFVICAEADSVEQACQLAEETHPDIVITDITLKHGDGIELVQRLKSLDARMRILVLSMHPDHVYAEQALRAGALGYINKEETAEKVIEAIRDVMAGRIRVSDAIREALLRRVHGARKVADDPVDTLTDREMEVFRLIGEGRKSTEIAEELKVSVKTIETHRDRIKKKLGLADGTELIRRAVLWVQKKDKAS
jgi:DNA-binding NarL/FixJ family response regulator